MSFSVLEYRPFSFNQNNFLCFFINNITCRILKNKVGLFEGLDFEYPSFDVIHPLFFINFQLSFDQVLIGKFYLIFNHYDDIYIIIINGICHQLYGYFYLDLDLECEYSLSFLCLFFSFLSLSLYPS